MRLQLLILLFSFFAGNFCFASDTCKKISIASLRKLAEETNYQARLFEANKHISDVDKESFLGQLIGVVAQKEFKNNYEYLKNDFENLAKYHLNIFYSKTNNSPELMSNAWCEELKNNKDSSEEQFKKQFCLFELPTAPCYFANYIMVAIDPKEFVMLDAFCKTLWDIELFAKNKNFSEDNELFFKVNKYLSKCSIEEQEILIGYFFGNIALDIVLRYIPFLNSKKLREKFIQYLERNNVEKEKVCKLINIQNTYCTGDVYEKLKRQYIKNGATDQKDFIKWEFNNNNYIVLPEHKFLKIQKFHEALDGDQVQNTWPFLYGETKESFFYSSKYFYNQKGNSEDLDKLKNIVAKLLNLEENFSEDEKIFFDSLLFYEYGKNDFIERHKEFLSAIIKVFNHSIFSNNDHRALELQQKIFLEDKNENAIIVNLMQPEITEEKKVLVQKLFLVSNVDDGYLGEERLTALVKYLKKFPRHTELTNYINSLITYQKERDVTKLACDNEQSMVLARLMQDAKKGENVGFNPEDEKSLEAFAKEMTKIAGHNSEKAIQLQKKFLEYCGYELEI